MLIISIRDLASWLEYRQRLGFLFSYLFQQKLELAEEPPIPSPTSSKELSFSGATGTPIASSVLLLGPIWKSREDRNSRHAAKYVFSVSLSLYGEAEIRPGTGAELFL